MITEYKGFTIAKGQNGWFYVISPSGLHCGEASSLQGAKNIINIQIQRGL